MYDVLSNYINKHCGSNDRMLVAGAIAKALKQKLYKLNHYLETQVQVANEQGYLIGSIIGRRRNFDEYNPVYGEAMNYRIQNTGAESMKIALIEIDKYLKQIAKKENKQQKEIGFIIMTVHDEIVVSLHNDYLHLAENLVRIMCDSLSNLLSIVKAESDWSLENYWKK